MKSAESFPGDRSNHDDNFKSYPNSLDEHVNAVEADTVLRPHQSEALDDLERFFENGDTRGYINLPTGTGKTVLFVKVSKMLMKTSIDGRKPKILVVAPTKDLVHQTLGKTGETGFGRFAPELNAGSYFSDTPDREKRQVNEYDVVVTTYRSFDVLSRPREYRPVTDLSQQAMVTESPDAERMVSKKRILDGFDFIMLDEAHHATGENTRRIIASLSPEVVVIGFTATPDVDDYSRLTEVLPVKIHELELNEAINMNLLAPIVPIGIRSNIGVNSEEIYDENGEFIDSRLSYLAENVDRNQKIVNIAKVFARERVGTIISCMAGGEAWHARHLAEELNKDGVNAFSVHGKISAGERQEIYRRFNEGAIDVLTFVGVLGEGWDSPRAKALINARPTRSKIFSKQRLGRVLRPGATAFSVDICDDFQDRTTPITCADVLMEREIEYGRVIGESDSEDKIQRILLSLERTQNGDILPMLESVFRNREEMIRGLEVLYRGHIFDSRGRATYATPSAINRNYHGLTDEMIARYEELYDTSITKKVVAQGKSVRMAYAIDEGIQMLRTIPRIEPGRYYVDSNREKWIAPQGIVKLFSKKYPQLSSDTLAEILLMTGSALEWMPCHYMSSPANAVYRHYRVAKIYKVTNDMLDAINRSLAEQCDEADIDYI